MTESNELTLTEFMDMFTKELNLDEFKEEQKEIARKHRYWTTWRTEIYKAIDDNDLDKIKEIEETPGFYIDTLNFLGETPIQYAKQFNNNIFVYLKSKYLK